MTTWWLGLVRDGEVDELDPLDVSRPVAGRLELGDVVQRAFGEVSKVEDWSITSGDESGPDREVAYHAKEFAGNLYIVDANRWNPLRHAATSGGFFRLGTGHDALNAFPAPELLQAMWRQDPAHYQVRTTRGRVNPYPGEFANFEMFSDTSYGNDVADSISFAIGGVPYLVWISAPRIFHRGGDARDQLMLTYELQELQFDGTEGSLAERLRAAIDDHNPDGDSILSTDDPAELSRYLTQLYNNARPAQTAARAEVISRSATSGAAALSPDNKLLHDFAKFTYNGWTFKAKLPHPASRHRPEGSITATHPDGDHVVQIDPMPDRPSAMVAVFDAGDMGIALDRKELPFPKLGRTPEGLLGIVRHTLDEWQPAPPHEDMTASRFANLDLDQGKRQPTPPDNEDDDTAQRFRLLELNPSSKHRRNPPRVYRLQKVVSKLEKDSTPLSPVRGGLVTSPDELVRNTLADYLSDRSTETFMILFINIRNKIIGYSEFTEGSPIQVSVTPTGIFQDALGVSAAAVVTVHNHPTGSADPSSADRALWRRLRDCGELLGIPVMDNLVVGRGEYFSEAQDSTVRFVSRAELAADRSTR